MKGDSRSRHAGSAALALALVVATTLVVIATVALGFVGRAWATDGVWVKQDSGSTKTLHAVFFVDSLNGWAVGNDATVLHTSDGGATWAAQSVPVGTAGDFRGVDFVNSTTGWIVSDGPGGDEKVLRTQDGGATWVATTMPNSSYLVSGLVDIDFFDAYHGVAGGFWTESFGSPVYSLARSGDGGTTWDCYHTAPLLYTTNVEWSDASNVWACGADPTSGLALWRSGNEGTTWSRVSTGVGTEGGEALGDLQEVDFVDAAHGWAVSDFVLDTAAGNGPVMLYTVDGGDNWSHRHWAEMGLGSADGIEAIDFVDQSHGWMVSNSTVRETSWRTSDGGLTWEIVALPDPTLLTDVDFVSESCGWAVGTDGAIFRYAIQGTPTDTTPPTTITDGCDDAWHNRAVSVTFSATDNVGGTGVDYTEYMVDSGPWTRGTQATIPASARGANDGLHTISYRSVDKSVPANVEATQACQVKIDTVGPVCKAKNVIVRRGKICRLRFYVGDALSAQVTTVIRVKTLRGVAKKTFSWGYDDANYWWWTSKYRMTLKKGVYRYYVYGNDLAGNKQSVVGWARLTVK